MPGYGGKATVRKGLELPKGVGGVHLVLGANGRPNGEAFVECGSEETAEAQLV